MIEIINTASLLNEIDVLQYTIQSINICEFCVHYAQKNAITKEKVYGMLTFLSEKGFIVKPPNDNVDFMLQNIQDIQISAEGRDYLEQNKKTNLDFIHKEIDRKVNIQLESIDTIDKKLNLALVFVSGILGFLVNSNWYGNLPSYAYWIILGGFGITITLVLIGMFVRSYAVDPSPIGLITNYYDSIYINTLYSVAKSKAEAHEKNKKRIQSKKKLANCSYLVLSLSIIVLLLFYALSI